MKIAQIAPLYEPVPPQLYGGTERVVAHLSDALVALGHEVTLFASGDTWTRARLASMRDRSLRLDPAPLKSDMAAHLAMLHRVRERMSEFDVLHFHVDLLHFPFFESVASRTLTTLHGRLDIKDLSEAYRRWSQYPLVSISDGQRRPIAPRSRRRVHWRSEWFDDVLEIGAVNGVDFRCDFERHFCSPCDFDRAVQPLFR